MFLLAPFEGGKGLTWDSVVMRTKESMELSGDNFRASGLKPTPPATPPGPLTPPPTRRVDDDDGDENDDGENDDDDGKAPLWTSPMEEDAGDAADKDGGANEVPEVTPSKSAAGI